MPICRAVALALSMCSAPMMRACGGITTAVPGGNCCVSRWTWVLCAKNTPPRNDATPWSKLRDRHAHVPSGPS
jgi:hypothetical protein